MGAGQEQPLLPAPYLLAPLAKPVPHECDRQHRRLAFLEEELVERLSEQVGPRTFADIRAMAPELLCFDGRRIAGVESAEKPLCLTGPPERRKLLARALNRYAVDHAGASCRIEVGPVPGDDGAPAPLPVRVECGETLELLDRGHGLRELAALEAEDLDLAPCDLVAGGPGPARRFGKPPGVDAKPAVPLEALRRAVDTPARRIDDAAARAVVLDEVLLLRVVFLGEAADEAHRRALPCVDVLIVVSHREQVQPRVVVGEGLSGERGNQLVLGLADVLVLIDQNPVEAPEHLLPGGECVRLAAAQEPGGIAKDGVERFVARVRGGLREGDPEDPHRERMAGHHVDAARVLSDQLVEAPPRLHRRVAIVGERQDAPRVLAPHADEVGDAVHQHPCLARSRAREHQHVGALPVVGDDSLLGPVAELPDNRFVVLGEGIAPERRLLALEPLVDERLACEFEVVHRKAQRQVDVVHAKLRVLGDDVDLCGLLGVVLLQRLEVRHREGPSVSRDLQRHRRAEYGRVLI